MTVIAVSVRVFVLFVRRGRRGNNNVVVVRIEGWAFIGYGARVVMLLSGVTISASTECLRTVGSSEGSVMVILVVEIRTVRGKGVRRDRAVWWLKGHSKPSSSRLHMEVALAGWRSCG